MDLPQRLEDFPEEIKLFLTDLYRRAEARLAGVIAAHGKRPGLGHALARARIGLLDAEMTPVFEAMARSATPVACARGCGSCCSLTISVTPDEVLALIHELRAMLTPPALAALAERVAANDRLGHGLAPLVRHRLRLFCPVLDPDSQSCLGHAARPNGCQGYLSLNLAQCHADHLDPPQRVTQPVAAGLLRDTIAAARDAVLSAQGLSAAPLELTAALAAGLADDGAEARWLAGESIFERASSIDNPSQING